MRPLSVSACGLWILYRVVVSLPLVQNETFRRHLNDKDEFDVFQYPPSAAVGLKIEHAKNLGNLEQSIILNR